MTDTVCVDVNFENGVCVETGLAGSHSRGNS